MPSNGPLDFRAVKQFSDIGRGHEGVAGNAIFPPTLCFRSLLWCRSLIRILPREIQNSRTSERCFSCPDASPFDLGATHKCAPVQAMLAMRLWLRLVMFFLFEGGGENAKFAHWTSKLTIAFRGQKEEKYISGHCFKRKLNGCSISCASAWFVF